MDKVCMHFSKITDAITGEITCGDCGVVLCEKIIDFGPENITQTNDDYQNNARTGQKISLKMADMGLSTIIQAQNKDSSGKSLSGQNKRSFYRLRIWDRNSRADITKQSYIKAFTFLDGIRSKLGLPDHVVEKSAYLFRKVEQKKLLTGRSNQSVLCAVVYMACRITITPRTLNDIADVAGIKKKVIQRTYRLLSANLDDVKSASFSPEEFVSRISSEAGISEKTKRDARKILEHSQKKGITSGKHPMSMAAAAVYLAIQDNHEKVSQTRLAQISGISAVTIRNRVRELQIRKRNQE
ncbi:transcription initiation factor IIB [Nitrosopumilus sp.]|uniref:transcription initiation factor IIB n=1 Tax=Nitrosopumilus sp. TaxID=2024843 RepID=UPI003B58CD73